MGRWGRGVIHFKMDSCWQQSAEDVSQFDSKFTSQTPVDSPDDSTLSESANQAFLVSVGAWCCTQTYIYIHVPLMPPS